MLLSLDIDITNQVQIQDGSVCISYSTNTLKKGVHPFILHLAMGK